VKVEMLIAGWLEAPAGVLRRDDDFGRQVRLPVPVFIIETADERILVDTGLHPAAVADPERHYGRSDALGPFQLEAAESIADQVDLATITKVVLTHLHFDHAAGLALLPSSVPIVVQRREWEAARDPAAVARNYYLPADYASVDRQITLIDGDHDLLGDGSIQLLLTPGHTPGHQSVQVGERLVIGGDVTHFATGLDDHRFPIFGDDLEAQGESADRLRKLRDAGATVLPGHDEDVLKPGPVLEQG
jgi:glyoxylase-like metal-dependent hydrolase (beta-lactamase superfamily II)